MFKFIILSTVLFYSAQSAPTESPDADEQLELLIDQIYPEITTYVTRLQIEELIDELLIVLRNSTTVERIALGMIKPAIGVMTKSQLEEIWASIEKAENGLGGIKQLEIVFYHALDALQDFMGDSILKERKEIKENANGKSENEIVALVYETLRQYINVEFGQKVVDTVKYSMTEEDWEIVSADASTYLNVDNFDLSY